MECEALQRETKLHVVTVSVIITVRILMSLLHPDAETAVRKRTAVCTAGYLRRRPHCSTVRR